MKVLLFTPPMVQVNTPYPATAYLTGFLRGRGIEAHQCDPSIEVVTRLFSSQGLQKIKDELLLQGHPHDESPDSVRFFLEAFEDYQRVIDPVIAFLQGKDPSLAHRLAARNLVPEGPRFLYLQELPESLEGAFGSLGIQDHAKHIASLALDDLADVVRLGINPQFQLSRYGEKLAASQASFDPLAAALEAPFSLIDEALKEVLIPHLERVKPDLVCMTVPFPGNVLGALRSAQIIRATCPDVKIALGGGYVNTELRTLEDPRIFDWVDFITLDDGERPLLCLIEYLEGKRPIMALFRTFVRQEGQVHLMNTAKEHDLPLKDCGMPTYDGLPLDHYLSMLEMLNPMHRLWSDLRWNKLTLAHGCYWKKCSFCDTSLDYIGRYDPAPADLIIDRMLKIMGETGQSGFHFVDEAAPPALLRTLSQRLIERKVTVTWWGNIRFDKAFTPDLISLMADAGCVAVSGGLEVASDRLLALMQKGVTVEQVAKVTRSFRESGILVHAYLMFGFPTQTEQETVDSLERVRQLFAEGCLQSAFWHRFTATVHSPVGLSPDSFGVEVREQPRAPGSALFARNDLLLFDQTPCDHDSLGGGLKKATFNFMHGLGLEEDIRVWFDSEVPRPKVPKDLVSKALKAGQTIASGLTRSLESKPSSRHSQKRRRRS